MSEQQPDFWKKLAAITAFVSALVGLGALIFKAMETARPVQIPMAQPTVGSPASSPVPSPVVSQGPTKTAPLDSATKKKSIAGGYTGTVRNESANLTGTLRLILQDAGGVLTGNAVVTDGLEGSGPLTGFSDGRRIAFTSTEPSTGITFAWEGLIAGDRISGTYVVSIPMALRVKRPDLKDEHGTWHVAR